MTLPIPANAALPASSEVRGLDSGGESAQTCLALLLRLEASLGLSQSALLALDLKAIEQGTAEQIRLGGELQALWFDDLRHHDRLLDAVRLDDPGMANAKPKVRASTLPRDQELAVEIKHVQGRVLHLTRVQAALLRRAQRFLLILSNTLARSYVTYRQNGSVTSIPDGSREGSDLCRA